MSYLDEIAESAGLLKVKEPDQPQGGSGDNTGAAAGAGGTGGGGGNAPADDDIDDEKFLAYARKKTGREIKSLDELKEAPPAVPAAALTPEQIEQQAQEKRNKALQFGLAKNKIKGLEELQNYAKDEAVAPRDFALNQYKAERLAENKDLTDEELENEFSDVNFESFDDTDPRRRRAIKLQEAAKLNHIQSTYGHILNIDKEYDEAEKEIAEKADYFKRVEAIGKSFPIKFDLPPIKDVDTDGKESTFTYTVNPSPETIKAVTEKYKGDWHFANLGKSKVDDKVILEAMMNEALRMELPKILTIVAKAHREDGIAAIKKGRLGTLPVRTGDGGSLAVGGGMGGYLAQVLQSHNK